MANRNVVKLYCPRGHTKKANKSGRTRCLICEQEQGKVLRQKNLEKARAQGRAQQKRRRTLNPSKVRNENWSWMLKREYGMSVEDYYRLLTEQDGCCAVCKVLPKEDQKLSVDHDHGSEVVRGLLCGFCNSGIGYFRDNSELLNAAIQYLQKEVKQYGVACEGQC